MQITIRIKQNNKNRGNERKKGVENLLKKIEKIINILYIKSVNINIICLFINKKIFYYSVLNISSPSYYYYYYKTKL